MLDIGSYQKQQVQQGADTPYTLQFLLEGRDTIDRDRLLEALKHHCGNVEAMDPASDLLAFAHTDHKIRFQEGMMPAQCMFTQPEDLSNVVELLRPSLTQTWDWKDVEQVVSRCKTVVNATDMLAGPLNRRVRLQLAHGMALALLDVLPVLAIHWLPSQRLVDPAFYKEGVEQGHLLVPSAVNVRMFKLEGTEQRVMDTMGLRGFGLPDLQCHFVNVDPMRVGVFLYECAEFVFERGDIIKPNDTIQGFEPSQKFRCSRGTSMVEPSRLVIDIQPGEFAAPR
jgi:hypothetical protein